MELIKSTTIPLFGAVSSQQGGRPENQDDYCFADTPLGFLCIVCDGMGGGPGGKTASYIAKTAIAEVVCGCSPQTPCDHALRMAIAKANEALEEKMQQVPQLVGMGSTCVAVLITPKSAFVAHAGDSRFYRLHGKKCLFRTNDHSLVGELVQRKALTEEQARVSPQSNVITRGLGSTTNHVPDIQEIPYQKGDRFVLCSDGVWGIMPHEELLNRLTAPTDLTSLVHTLSADIDNLGFSHGGGHDNHTLAIIEINADSAMKTSNRHISWPLIFGVALGLILVLAIGGTATWIISNKMNKKGQTSSDNNQIVYSQPPSRQRNSGCSTYGSVTTDTTTTASATSSPKGMVDDDADEDSQTKKKEKENKDAINQPQQAQAPKEDEMDSRTSPSNNSAVLPTKVLTQRIIDILKDAKQLKRKNSREIAQRLLEYQNEVVIHLDTLMTRFPSDTDRHKFMSRMSNALRKEDLWDHTKDPNKEGDYCTTPTCSQRLENYERQMQKFHNNLPNDR